MGRVHTNIQRPGPAEVLEAAVPRAREPGRGTCDGLTVEASYLPGETVHHVGPKPLIRREMPTVFNPEVLWVGR